MSLEDKLYPLLSIYERLPRAPKRLAGSIYRHLPETIRRGKSYGEFKRLAEEGEAWDRTQIQEYQFNQLREVLNHAADHCSYYRERFKRAGFDAKKFDSFDDLERIPLLEKRDLLESRDKMLSGAFPAGARLYITTGGSTGVPVGFYLQRGISRPKEQAFLEAMWKRSGYFDGARLVLLRGQVTSSQAEGRISSYDATRDWLMLSSYHLTPERLDLYLREVERFRPDLLYVYPSSALQLVEYLQARNCRWPVPLRGVLCGSERLTEPQRKLLESTFGCRAYSWYGHSERVILAAEGRATTNYYFVPQYGYVEFGAPNADGMREVIGTSFHNLVMPLIRYRTGDYVRLLEENAPREYPLPAATEIGGREQEFLLSGSGRKISLTAFNMHDAIFDHLYAVQFYQDRPGFAEFRYIPGPQFQSSRLPVIEAGIRRKLGDDFTIEFKPVREVEKTAAGKHRWIVSKL